jgi:vitamin B12 transport system permease protein
MQKLPILAPDQADQRKTQGRPAKMLRLRWGRRMTFRQIASECLGLLCAVMLGLAAGAVWMLPMAYTGRPLPWLALPAGWLLGAAMRIWVHTSRLGASLLAALATVLACLYARCLLEGVQLAGITGYGMLEAMRTAGPDMLLALARISLGKLDALWFAAGMVLAVRNARR